MCAHSPRIRGTYIIQFNSLTTAAPRVRMQLAAQTQQRSGNAEFTGERDCLSAFESKTAPYSPIFQYCGMVAATPSGLLALLVPSVDRPPSAVANLSDSSFSRRPTSSQSHASSNGFAASTDSFCAIERDRAQRQVKCGRWRRSTARLQSPKKITARRSTHSSQDSILQTARQTQIKNSQFHPAK